MLVYNTSPAGTGTPPFDVSPGFYYHDGTNWVRVASNSDIDLRLVSPTNHITVDAGNGSDGTDAGTGINNIAIGATALGGITTGSDNLAMNTNAGGALTTSTNNVLLGTGAGSILTTAHAHLGPDAGLIFTDYICLLYTSPSPRDKRQSRMPSSA